MAKGEDVIFLGAGGGTRELLGLVRNATEHAGTPAARHLSEARIRTRWPCILELRRLPRDWPNPPARDPG